MKKMEIFLIFDDPNLRSWKMEYISIFSMPNPFSPLKSLWVDKRTEQVKIFATYFRFWLGQVKSIKLNHSQTRGQFFQQNEKCSIFKIQKLKDESIFYQFTINPLSPLPWTYIEKTLYVRHNQYHILSEHYLFFFIFILFFILPYSIRGGGSRALSEKRVDHVMMMFIPMYLLSCIYVKKLMERNKSLVTLNTVFSVNSKIIFCKNS